MLSILNGWKTRIFSGFIALLGLVTTLDPTLLRSVIPTEKQGYVFIGIAVAVWLLRQFTTTPAGEKEKLDN